MFKVLLLGFVVFVAGCETTQPTSRGDSFQDIAEDLKYGVFYRPRAAPPPEYSAPIERDYWYYDDGTYCRRSGRYVTCNRP